VKKTSLSILVTAFMVISLACQAINTLTNPQLDTPTPIATLTELPDTATPTEPVPGAEAWIAFENQNNLWLVHPDGSGLTPVTDNSQNISIGNFKWSPKGTLLAYAQSDQGVTSLFLFDIRTSKTIPLLQNIGGGFDWLPNGRQIVYDTLFTGDFPGEFRNEGLWVVNVADQKTGQLVKSTSDIPTIMNPEMFSGGNSILFTIPCFEANCVGYGIVDYTSGNFIMLPTFGGLCEWSPIALDIACIRIAAETSTGHSRQEIAILDKLGSLKRSFPLPESVQHVALHWSPDGKNLVLGYYSKDAGQTDILSLETGESQPLATGLPSGWSPDGQWVLTWQSDLNNSSTSNLVNVRSGQVFPLAEGMSPLWQPVTSDTSANSQGIDATGTPTLIPVETNTPTPEGPCTDLTLKIRDTNKGDYLQLCSNGNEYEIGPLEKGGYAIGPNKMFFVYASNSGTVYAARVGDTRLTVLGDVKDFLFVLRDRTPQFEFQFLGEHPYTVEVHEMIFDQKKLLPVPRRISAPN
jgi:hypothetical protein